MRGFLALLAVALVAAIVFTTTRSRERAPEGAPAPPAVAKDLHGLPASRFLIEHDRFIASTDPRVVPAEDARWLEPGSEVFGVVLDGVARAYPIPMIAYHHVVNDRLAGIPIAVTY
jgi:hypothetical protein